MDMSYRTLGIGLSVALGLVLLVAGLARGPVSAQEKAAPAAQRWEYKVVLLDNGRDNDPRANQGNFDKLGAEGWELAALHSGSQPGYCVFKRPRR
jgi:hypothetical protein